LALLNHFTIPLAIPPHLLLFRRWGTGRYLGLASSRVKVS